VQRTSDNPVGKLIQCRPTVYYRIIAQTFVFGYFLVQKRWQPFVHYNVLHKIPSSSVYLIMGCLHDPPNVQQTSENVFKICVLMLNVC